MHAAWPLPPLPIAAEVRRPHLTLLGLVIGAAVPALVASIAWWLDVPWVAAIAAIGIPIGATIGAGAGPRMAGPSWVGETILAGLAAPLVPGALIGAAFFIGAVASAVDTGLVDVAGGFFFGALYGAVMVLIAELAGSPITLPVAFVVALLVRRAAAMPVRRATIHVTALVVITSVVGLVTLAAMAGLLLPFGIGRIDSGY
jgi:hypothetical protein